VFPQAFERHVGETTVTYVSHHAQHRSRSRSCEKHATAQWAPGLSTAKEVTGLAPSTKLVSRGAQL
jgi:hypothetical protein